jgi:hypothetical protein
MRPSSLAIDLEDTAATMRRAVSTFQELGGPVEVPWPHGDGTKVLHMLTYDDIIADAEALEHDADKLRSLYSENPKWKN